MSPARPAGRGRPRLCLLEQEGQVGNEERNRFTVFITLSLVSCGLICLVSFHNVFTHLTDIDLYFGVVCEPSVIMIIGRLRFVLN